ncbi:hypothetical protein B0I35DRAFT_152664 [Stachybotrys elegans]|uniref:Uncharacterized protein n=1 Tax=Stachybotrys elegans TaxID=80388 RepID=A0A8K0SCV8_9HYPO|nr:hypothetical protein B0I35DRAFT_152664 [Stachybotrys elegans]
MNSCIFETLPDRNKKYLKLCIAQPYIPTMEEMLEIEAFTIVDLEFDETTLEIRVPIDLYHHLPEPISVDHPNWAHQMRQLGVAYLERYKDTSNLTDLTQAIKIFEDGLASIPPAHPERIAFLVSHSSALYSKYVETARMTDLAQCILVREEALQLTASDDPSRIARLESLIRVYEDR